MVENQRRIGLEQEFFLVDRSGELTHQGELLYAAATEGIKHPAVNEYVDSILNFALADSGAGAQFLANLRSELDQYRTIESEILQAFVPATAELSREVGLRLVQTCCATFEEQIKVLEVEHPLNVLDDLSSAVWKNKGSKEIGK